MLTKITHNTWMLNNSEIIQKYISVSKMVKKEDRVQFEWWPSFDQSIIKLEAKTLKDAVEEIKGIVEKRNDLSHKD